jgi:putative restriction endonuclease
MLEHFMTAFGRLNRDINRNRWTALTNHGAPYKPILLLSIFDLISQGVIKSNFIELSAELCDVFQGYWSLVIPPEQRSNIAMPFFYLRSEGFWHLIPFPGKENELNAILDGNVALTTVNKLKEFTLGAKFDEELFEYLKIKGNRDILRSILIEKYFAPEARPLLFDQTELNDEAYYYSLQLLKERSDFKIDPGEIKPAARSQGFRIAVVKTYAHRCSTCGIRIITADGHTIVEAAHIVPFSVSCNDDPRNGLCLCRSCHWNFDEGLIGISAKYEVMTSPQLTAFENLPSYVLPLKGRGIIHPIEDKFMPDLDALEWHRREIFRRV